MYDKEIAGKLQPTSDDVSLLLGRSRLILGYQELEVNDLKQDKPKAIADAVEAAKLALEGKLSSQIQAQAYYQVAWGYYEKSDIAELDDSCAKALENAKEAVRLAPASPESWLWRKTAALACLKLMLKAGRDTAEGQKYEADAIEYFTSVKDDKKAPTGEHRKAQDYLTKLRR